MQNIFVKISNPNITFCYLSGLVAICSTTICGSFTLNEAAKYVILVSWIIGLVGFFVPKIANRVKIAMALVLVAICLPLLINFSFTDGTPNNDYYGVFVTKYKYTPSRTNTPCYKVVYKAANGRRETEDVSKEVYLADSYPLSKRMYERHGILGANVNRPEVPLSGRISWFFFWLNLFCVAAIYCYSKHTISAIGQKSCWVNLFILVANFITIFYPCTLTDYLVICTSPAGILLALFFAINYWSAKKRLTVPAIIISKHINTTNTKRGTIISYSFLIEFPSGITKIRDTDQTSYNEASEGLSIPIKVGIGCFGMYVCLPSLKL